MDMIDACDVYAAPPIFDNISSIQVNTQEQVCEIHPALVAGLHTEQNILKMHFKVKHGFRTLLKKFVELADKDVLDVVVQWGEEVRHSMRISFNVFVCDLEYSWSESGDLIGTVVFESPEANFVIESFSDSGEEDYFKVR